MADCIGLEELFREQRRLATKMTNDEVAAVKKFVKNVVIRENESLLFRLDSVTAEYGRYVQESTSEIVALEGELQEKTDALSQLRQSSASLTDIYKRWEGKYADMQQRLNDKINFYKRNVVNLNMELWRVKTVIAKKGHVISGGEKGYAGQWYSDLDGGERRTLLNKIEQQNRTILKSKYNLLNREKLIASIESRLALEEEEKEKLRQEKEAEALMAAELRTQLQRANAEVTEKCEDVTRLYFQMDQERQRATKLDRVVADLKRPREKSHEKQSKLPPVRKGREAVGY